MKSIFKTLFLSLCIIANTHFAYSQTASILPQGKTQFLDNNGKPLTSGTVDFYIPSTTTRKTTWQNSGETVANTNPVILDAGGRAIIYGDGSYRMVVKDRLGNLIYDQLTSSTGSGSSPSTATGDGDLVGTVKPWAGMTAPNQYMFTYGQEVSRTTYSALYTAITSTQPVFCNSGSPTLNGLSDTTNFWIGMTVEVSCVVAGFSTIVSKTASSVTLAANSNLTTNVNATFYPWGRGNGTTTFNLPDFRGLTLAGNNIMGGVASSNLTTTYFGSTDPNSSGAAGGSQSQTLTLSQLPTGITSANTGSIALSVTSATTDYGRSPGGANQSATAAGTTFGSNNSWIFQQIPSSGTLAIGAVNVTSNNTSGSPHSLVQPTKTVNYIIKVTPDSNSTTASGVTSLGGMTGDIACGSGLNCSGNIISFGGGVINALSGAFGGCTIGSDTLCNNGSATFYGQTVFNIARTVTSPNAIDDIAIAPSTTTITGNTGSPISKLSKVTIYSPTFTDASALTITDAANLYIDGPPIAAGSATFTRKWSAFLNNGSMWLSGTGQNNGRLLIGNVVPSDWPVDAFVVTSELSGENSVAVNSAPVLATPPGSNKIASAFTSQGQVAAGQAWTTYYGARLFGLLLNAGSSIVNQYGLNVPAISGATTINQAIYVEGGSTTGRVGFGESNAQHQFVLSSNAQQGLVGPTSTQFLMAGDNTSGAVQTLIGWGGALANSQIQGIKVSGTAAAPTATAANSVLFQFFASGYNGVTPNTYTAGARIDFSATGTLWSNTNSGAFIDFYTTADGTTGATQKFRMNGSGCLGVGTTTDCGAGGIIANTMIQTVATTVGSLGTCNAGAKGERKFVSDSNAASYTAGIGAIVAAGGTTNVPVVCDGTNWRIG